MDQSTLAHTDNIDKQPSKDQTNTYDMDNIEKQPSKDLSGSVSTFPRACNLLLNYIFIQYVYINL